MMLNLKTIMRRLGALNSSEVADRELDEELQFHLEMRTADNLAGGMRPAAARADAQRRFGDLEGVKGLCRRIDDDSAVKQWLRATLWLMVVCGAALWANTKVAQVDVMGEILVITAALCRLLIAIRSTRPRTIYF